MKQKGTSLFNQILDKTTKALPNLALERNVQSVYLSSSSRAGSNIGNMSDLTTKSTASGSVVSCQLSHLWVQKFQK